MKLNLISSLDVLVPSALWIYLSISGKRQGWGDYMYWLITSLAIGYTLGKVLNKLLLWDNNLFVYHLMALVNLIVLFLFFKEKLQPMPQFKLIKVLLLIILITYSVGLFTWETIWDYPSILSTGVALVMVLLALMFYWKYIRSKTQLKMTRSREFWHVTGILTYYGTSIFISAAYRVLTQKNLENVGILWQLHNIFLTIMCIYLFIGYLCKPLQTK